MVAALIEIIADSSEVQSLNIPEPILITLSGNTISVMLLQFENAESPIVTTPLEIAISLRLSQELKADPPM